MTPSEDNATTWRPDPNALYLPPSWGLKQMFFFFEMPRNDGTYRYENAPRDAFSYQWGNDQPLFGRNLRNDAG